MICIIFILLMIIFILVRIIKYEDDLLVQNEIKKQQNMQLYELMLKWFENDRKQINLEKFFVDNDVKEIAIYGKGKLGELFFFDITKTHHIDYVCWIDKALATDLKQEIKIFNIADVNEYANVDMIVVTPIQYYDDIEKELYSLGIRTEIVSLEDIVFSI